MPSWAFVLIFIKTAEGAARLREWFRYSDGEDRLAESSSQEKDGRIERCRARFSFILVALIQTAQQIPKAEFDDPDKRKELPFGSAWWPFFSRCLSKRFSI